MTAIAGLIDDGKVYIGGDSAGVGGLSLHRRKDPKVFKNGEFVIGYTSSFRMGQLLRYYLSPDTPKEGQDAFEYMVCSFVPKVRQVLKDNGYLKVESNTETGGFFVVGWRGRLYEIQSDMQVSETLVPYTATGCGEDLVLGSLHATEQLEGLSPKERITMALQAAEDFSAGVRGPFNIVSAG